MSNNSPDALPLAPMQEAMLAMAGTIPQGTHIMQIVVNLEEPLSAEKLQQAWNKVYRDHATLRAWFNDNDDQQAPTQMVSDSLELPWSMLNFESCPPSVQQEKWLSFLACDRAAGFKLSHPPLMRVTLIRFSQTHHRMCWTFHHILLDGRSVSIVLNQLFAEYDSRPLKLPGPTIPFHDFLHWYSEWKISKIGKATDFWNKNLKNFPGQPSMPFEHRERPPSNNQRAEPLQCELTVEETISLNQAAAKIAVTMNTMIQAAWALTLATFTGTGDIVIGIVRAGRHGHIKNAMGASGMFINTIPMRVDGLFDDIPVGQWLQKLRARQISMRPFEHTPPTMLAGWLQRKPGVPPYESLLVFEDYKLNQQLASLCSPNPGMRTFELLERPDFPLVLSAASGTTLTLKLSFNKEQFEPEAMPELFRQFQRFLYQLSLDPERSLSRLPLLDDLEIKKIIQQNTCGTTPLPELPYLHSGFEKSAAFNPENVSMLWKNDSWTYRELNQYANRIANFLIDNGVIAESRIVVILKKTLRLPAVILGILKAGGVYIPIDASLHPVNVARLLATTRANIAIIDCPLPDIASAHNVKILTIDSIWPKILSQPDTRPSVKIEPSGLAYAIFTSGSSGEPNLVGVEHRQITNLLAYATCNLLTHEDLSVVPFIDSIGFDSCISQIFTTLGLGGVLVFFPDLAAVLHSEWANKLTAIGTTPSVLGALLDAGELPPSMRLIALGGEVIPPALIAKLKARKHIRKVLNYYGPTETTVYSTVADLIEPTSASAKTIGRNIGQPIHNTRVYLLDCRGRPLPIGAPGEIHIGGRGVARGYLNSPELTLKRFTSDPLALEADARRYRTGDKGRFLTDGSIEFLGRFDTQLKVRGIRVDATTIEAAIEVCPAVHRAIVNNRKDLSGKDILVAYIVPSEHEKRLGTTDLAKVLKEKLPGYMMPAALVRLKRFPLTINGKVDRVKLLTLEFEAIAAVNEIIPPATPLEELLADIWSEFLETKSIGRDNNFFELGGDSLLAVRVIARMRSTLSIVVTVKVLFNNPTIRDLGEYLAPKLAAELSEDVANINPRSKNIESSLLETSLKGDISIDQILLRQRPFILPWEGKQSTPESFIFSLNNSGAKPRLFWCLQGNGEFKQLAAELGNEQPLYAMRSGYLVMEYTRNNIEALASYYATEMIKLQPERPFLIGGNCQGGIIAHAIALHLRQLGRKVDLLLLLEADKPLEYLGPIALLFGRNSPFNPYRSKVDAMDSFKKAYPNGFTVSLIDGEHGEFFNPENISYLAAAVSSELSRITYCSPH